MKKEIREFISLPMAERFFKPGSLVRFAPPPGAYSPCSEQARHVGETCLIIHAWNDSQATVTFGAGVPIVVSQDYLTQI